MGSTKWARLLPVAAVATSACALVLAAPAGADSVDGCSTPLSQPFLPWLDPFAYAPVPGGSFEAGLPPWQLSGPTSVVPDNEPWHVGGAGTAALSLRPGGSAVSPSFCVGLLAPTVRLFVRSSTLLPAAAAFSVDLDTGAGTLTLPLGIVAAGPAWQPTPPLPLLANLTSVLAGSFAAARLRVDALTGDVRIDDVYVDPFKTS